MSTPYASGRSALSTVHLAAADALAALFAQGEQWPPTSPLRFRNLLLDACGSDHRPLIELLLRVGRHGIVDALHALGTVPAAAWPTRRTTLVSRACGELFIDAEMAAWAVDAWAVALGVVPRSAAQALQVEYAASASRAHQRADAGAARTARAGRLNTAPTAPARVAVTGGATNARVGAWKRGAAAAIMASPRWRVPAASVPAPNLAPYYRVLAIVGVLMLGAVVWQRLSARDAPVSSRVAGEAAADSAIGPPSANATDVSVSAAAGGSVRAERVVADRLVAPDTSSVNAPPAPTAARPTDNDAARVAVRTITPEFANDIRQRGVGGVYVVQQRIVSVGGNALCDPLADALSRRVMQSEEEISHEPGSTQFALVTRPGVRGTLSTDGVFRTAPHSGTHDGIRFAFRMSGRFTATGFIARTVTETDAVIKYRQQQRCVVVADLMGARAPAAVAP